MKELLTKLLAFDYDEDAMICEVSIWNDDYPRATINLPKGNVKISEDTLYIETDYGDIQLRFPEKLTEMALQYPDAREPLIIRRKKEDEP
jgi:hypothetical protein